MWKMIWYESCILPFESLYVKSRDMTPMQAIFLGGFCCTSQFLMTLEILKILISNFFGFLLHTAVLFSRNHSKKSSVARRVLRFAQLPCVRLKTRWHDSHSKLQANFLFFVARRSFLQFRWSSKICSRSRSSPFASKCVCSVPCVAA